MFKSFISVVVGILFLFTTNARAEQITLEKAKFEIAKKAVWFYSKDKVAFKKASDCPDAKDFAELIKCASKMDGVKDRVTKWSKTPVKSTDDLKKLVDSIKAEFTVNPKRAYRDTVPERKVFDDDCQNIIKDIEDKQFDVPAQDTALSTNLAGHNNSTDKTGSKTNTDATPNNSAAVTGYNYTLWIVVLMLLVLAGIFYTRVVTNKLKQDFKDYKERNNVSGGKDVPADLANRIAKLEREVRSFDESLDALRDELTKKITRVNTHTQEPAYTPPKNSVHEIRDNSVKQASTVKYAKWADEGDAFSLSALTDEAGNEKIFEITLVSPTNAKYKVTSNRNAQLFALTNYDRYLGKTCRYDTIPTANSQIINGNDGELRLQGNRWQIVSPAEIRFES